MPARMPLRKNKVYARFNVGQYMKHWRQTTIEAAITHKSIVEARKIVIANKAKLKRLENKVSCGFIKIY